MAYFLAFSEYNPRKVVENLRDIRSLGCNWVSLDVALWQESWRNPEIALPFATEYRHPFLPSVYKPDLWHHYPADESVRHFLDSAHRIGLKVMFKPHIHPEKTGMRMIIGKDGKMSDPMWPGRVHMRTESDWDEWFDNYRNILDYYLARFDFDAICVGNELSGTYGQSDRWRRLIAHIRAEHPDLPVTCAFNWWVVIRHQKKILLKIITALNLEDDLIRRLLRQHGYSVEFDEGVLRELAVDTFGESPDWVDALDWVGLNFYFPLSNQKSPSLNTLKQAWHRYPVDLVIGSTEINYVKGIRDWSREIGKPILFTEGGWGKWDYAAKFPGNWYVSESRNPELQARCYQAFFEEAYPLAVGVYFWDWAEPSFSPWNGPAADIVRRYFLEGERNDAD